MSQRRTDGNGGVPFIKDVPLVGNLFKSRSRSGNKTELVLMIVPYIVESDHQATALTRALGDKLELLQLPVSTPVQAPLQVPAQAPRPR